MKYKTIQLKDVADVVMGQSPKSNFYNTEGKGVPFLQGVRTFGENYPSIDTYTTSFNREAQSGEILFSVRAPVGRVNWANQRIAIGRGLAAIKVKEEYSKNYLYYLFKKIGEHLDSLASGTVFTSINKKELGELRLKIPVDLANQEKVANYLKKLDNKIEVNTQINDNLSKFRELLYMRLIQSSDVKEVKLTELFNIAYGKNIAKSELTKSGTKVFGANGLIGYTQKPSIISAPTVTITSRGSGSGYVSYLNIGNAFLTNNLLYLNENKNLGLSFSYETIKSANPKQFVTGSAQPQLTIKNLSQSLVKIPSDINLVNKFRRQMYPIEEIIKHNSFENEKLEMLKNTLLNKCF